MGHGVVVLGWECTQKVCSSFSRTTSRFVSSCASFRALSSRLMPYSANPPGNASPIGGFFRMMRIIPSFPARSYSMMMSVVG